MDSAQLNGDLDVNYKAKLKQRIIPRSSQLRPLLRPTEEILQMPTDKESDCVAISPSNGHAINSSQCDNSPRPGQEEIPEREEREDKGELKERPQLHMSEMASDTKEEKLVSTRVKKSISYSKSMDSRSGTSTPAGDSGNGAHRPHNLPLPFALATDKRVTGKPSQPSVFPVGSRNGERVLEKSSSHKIQGIATRKPLHPDNSLHPDDDDTCSVTSSTPSRFSRSKLTVPIAPTFRIGERLQKRREYYSKLEEKHQAMEAEKLQAEARKKEEQEAAIREMRKTMVPRANPVPSFYHEPPPAKVELKKVPPTRAKSPKLTRRKSCSDARERDGYCCRMHRNSLDSCHNETAKIAPSTPKTSIMTTTKAASKPVRQKPAGQTGTGTNITVHT